MSFYSYGVVLISSGQEEYTIPVYCIQIIPYGTSSSFIILYFVGPRKSNLCATVIINFDSKRSMREMHENVFFHFRLERFYNSLSLFTCVQASKQSMILCANSLCAYVEAGQFISRSFGSPCHFGFFL